jgi:hypothetical protein
MLGRPHNLMRLLYSQHEEEMAAHEAAMAAHKETMSSLEKMGEENKRRHEERLSENERRDEEWKADLARRDEEMREFNREILLRNEKVYTAVLAELEEGRKQLRANTQAVLSVLDRLS